MGSCCSVAINSPNISFVPSEPYLEDSEINGTYISRHIYFHVTCDATIYKFKGIDDNDWFVGIAPISLNDNCSNATPNLARIQRGFDQMINEQSIKVWAKLGGLTSFCNSPIYEVDANSMADLNYVRSSESIGIWDMTCDISFMAPEGITSRLTSNGDIYLTKPSFKKKTCTGSMFRLDSEELDWSIAVSPWTTTDSCKPSQVDLEVLKIRFEKELSERHQYEGSHYALVGWCSRIDKGNWHAHIRYQRRDVMSSVFRIPCYDM